MKETRWKIFNYSYIREFIHSLIYFPLLPYRGRHIWTCLWRRLCYHFISPLSKHPLPARPRPLWALPLRPPCHPPFIFPFPLLIPVHACLSISRWPRNPPPSTSTSKLHGDVAPPSPLCPPLPHLNPGGRVSRCAPFRSPPGVIYVTLHCWTDRYRIVSAACNCFLQSVL